jgi:type VI secretion system secreted protein VgrG
MHNKNVGVASTEQIGTAKVSTVGQVFKQKVGHTYHIDVGDEFTIGVGASTDKNGNPNPPTASIKMTKDGTILMRGVKIYVGAGAHIQLISAMIDNN